MFDGRFAHRATNLFTQRQNLIDVTALHQDAKLFAPDAGRQGMSGQRYLADRGCHHLESSIARRMTVTIVVELKKIDIDEQHGQRPFILHAFVRKALEVVVELAAVRDASKRVLSG